MIRIKRLAGTGSCGDSPIVGSPLRTEPAGGIADQGPLRPCPLRAFLFSASAKVFCRAPGSRL